MVRLYLEEQYQPQRSSTMQYQPEVVDAIARWVQEEFKLAELPDIGLIRHIYMAPANGLSRLVKERNPDKPLTDKKLQRIEGVLTQTVEDLKRTIPEQLAKQREEELTERYQGPDVHQMSEYSQESSETEDVLKSLVSDMLLNLGNEKRKDCKLIEKTIKSLPPEIRADAERSNLLAYCKDSITQAYQLQVRVAFIAQDIAMAFSRSLFLERGYMIFGIDVSDGYISQETECSPNVDRVHRLMQMDSDASSIGIAYADRVHPDKDELSPCYDDMNHYVRMDTHHLSNELLKVLMYGTRRAPRTEDYREGRAEKKYYGSIWQRHKSADSADRIFQQFYTYHPELKVYKLNDVP